LEKTYRLNKGEIKLIHSTRLYGIEFKNLLHKMFMAVLYTALFIGTCFVTWIIYKKCIVHMDLENTISLGAVFATLGSSLVAVSSLVCNEQYSQFMDNARILEEKLFNQGKWQRWPFVKRLQKNKVARGEYFYYILHNPSVIFMGSHWELKISLPSGKYDFRELPVYLTILKLIWYKKKFVAMVFDQQKMDDLLVWQCLMRLYYNILLYRWNQIVIWTGSCFIFSSIFFSFFYIQISAFFNDGLGLA